MSADDLIQENVAPIVIQQLNLGYNQEQDRLLLKVGLSDNTELSVWLSYRIAKSIWGLLNKETHLPKPEATPAETAPQAAVAQFKQEVEAVQKLQKLDFQTEYQPRKESVNSGPMLVTQAQLHMQGEKPAQLELVCLEGLNVGINLNQETILALCNMLQLTCKEATWEIGASTTAAASVVMLESESKQVLH